MIYKEKISKFADLILQHNKIVAFTGAGISTDSGIPDLSNITSILDQEEKYFGSIFGMLNRSFATQNPKLFYELYRKTFFHPEAMPNTCHYFLSTLERIEKLLGVVTMNIDFLHQKAGAKNVYEYWGDMRKNRCTKCEHEYDWDLAQKERVPLCPRCGGVVIPEFVFNNLGVYSEEIKKSKYLIDKADLIIVAGTKQSRQAFPSNIPKIIVNLEAPYHIDKNTLFIQGNINSIFTDLNEMLNIKTKKEDLFVLKNRK